MTLIKHKIFESRPFQEIVTLSAKTKKEVYLVGGFLRDILTGRRKDSIDLDFSVDNGAIEFGRRIAKKLKAGFVVLDREHGCSRVVLKTKDKEKFWTFDFVDFRGRNITEDLKKRDFTINTLAMPLIGEKRGLIDYYGAKKDISRKTVRVVEKSSLDEDPLRILRAFSLSAIFNFKISSDTISLIKRKKGALKSVAGERVRDELFKILAVGDSWRHIKSMDRLEVLELVIPQIGVMHNVKQGGYHHLDVWGHTLETLKKLEELLLSFSQDKEINSYLDENLAGGRTRRQLLKLAALLHDIGKPEAFEVKAGKTMFHGHERIGRIISDSVSERLKLSTTEKFALDTIIFWHLRPGYLADVEVLTNRAVHRYFRDTRREAVSVLLIAVADQRATRGPMASAASRRKHEKVSFSLIKKYFEMLKEEPFKRVINGKDLIKYLHLEPGPVFSKILNAVEEAQIENKFKTKAEAIIFVRGLVKKLKQRRVAGKKIRPKVTEES